MFILIIDWILIVLWGTKCVSVVAAALWLRLRGERYKELAQDWDKPPRALIVAMNDAGGRWVPFFGVNDYKVKRVWVERDRRWWPLALVWDKVLYRGHYLGLFVVAWAYSTTAVWPPHNSLQSHMLVLSWATLTSFIETLLLAFETLIAVIILGNYAYSFQLNWRVGSSRRLAELKWFSLRLFRVWLAGLTMVYVWQLHWNVLTGDALTRANTGQWEACWRLLLQCGYFTEVTMATVGFGDLSPRNGLGQVAAFVIILCSFLWVTVTFATIATVRERG